MGEEKDEEDWRKEEGRGDESVSDDGAWRGNGRLHKIKWKKARVRDEEDSRQPQRFDY